MGGASGLHLGRTMSLPHQMPRGKAQKALPGRAEAIFELFLIGRHQGEPWHWVGSMSWAKEGETEGEPFSLGLLAWARKLDQLTRDSEALGPL